MSYAKALSLIPLGRANLSEYLCVQPSKYTLLSDIAEYITYFTRAITLPGTANSVLGLLGQEDLAIQRNVITGRQFGSPVVMTFSDRIDLIVYQTIKYWIDASVLNFSQGLKANRSLRVQYYDEIKADVKICKTKPERNIRDPRVDYFRGGMVTGLLTFNNCIPLSIEQTTL